MDQFGEYDFYRSILEEMHAAVYVVNREGKILFWNDGAERITGYLRQDVIGHIHNDNFLGEIDADDNELTGKFSPSAVAMREGKPAQGHRISLRHKSGHRVNVELWSFPVRNAQGIIVEPLKPSTKALPSETGTADKPS
jgi:PAS domain S-box-containing protein